MPDILNTVNSVECEISFYIFFIMGDGHQKIKIIHLFKI